MKRLALFAFMLLIAVAPGVFAQKRLLTFEDIYDPVKRINFSGITHSGFEWLDEESFTWPRRDAAGKLIEFSVYDVKSGTMRPLFDRDTMRRALVAAGAGTDDAKVASESSALVFDAKRTAALLVIGDDLYHYAFAKKVATRLTSSPAREEEVAFSPDGQKVAFVRENDLWVVDLSGRERRLTTDGSAKLLNGKLDWVYQEEIYGRGTHRGFWWSPDSQRIAFLQLDESDVPEFTVVDHIPTHQALEVYPYPKPGDPNPRASLRVVPASGGAVVVVDNERYSAGEHLIVSVAWDPAGTAVFYQVQDREQTWMDLLSATPDGKSTKLFRESTKAWIEPLASPHWLADDTFLWQSEREGYRHLYHYRRDGTLISQVTKGEWEVRDFHGIDEKSKTIYFSATERSPIGLDVYRIQLDGSDMRRLSEAAGTHGVTFSPAKTRYVDRWSDINTPDQVRVHRNDGSVLKVVEANRIAELDQLQLQKPEFLQVKTRDGFPMEAMIIRPPDFDPAKKYPVYQYLYAGPHAPQVVNRWRGPSGMFNQLVAQQGVIVWICDNRTASGKGAVSAWPAYKQLGVSELQDLEDAIDWLGKQPGVDASRVLINGWSYGGFMVSYAMTHSDRFSAGIAGGSVTDWRNYDSIYTERFMLMPQNNPEGYARTSARAAAKNLKGNLLLLHGTMDDNVHVSNTLQFAYDLQQAGKPFEMMLFPKARHGVVQRSSAAFMQRLVLDFIRRNLLGGGAGEQAAPRN